MLATNSLPTWLAGKSTRNSMFFSARNLYFYKGISCFVPGGEYLWISGVNHSMAYHSLGRSWTPPWWQKLSMFVRNRSLIINLPRYNHRLSCWDLIVLHICLHPFLFFSHLFPYNRCVFHLFPIFVPSWTIFSTLLSGGYEGAIKGAFGVSIFPTNIPYSMGSCSELRSEFPNHLKLNTAIENGPVEIVTFPAESGDFH